MGAGDKKVTPYKNMGNSESVTNTQKRHELRNTSMPIRLPMPDPSELDRRFTKVLVRFILKLVAGQLSLKSSLPLSQLGLIQLGPVYFKRVHG